MNSMRGSSMVKCFLDNGLLSSEEIDGSIIYSITDDGTDYIEKLCLGKCSHSKTDSVVLKEIGVTLLIDYFDC